MPDTYRTTQPIILPLSQRRPIEFRSSHGYVGELRVPEASDLDALHRLRTQCEVMVNSSQGRIDESLEETQTWMHRFMPPNDRVTFNWCVWTRHEDHDWEHVGILGVHTLSPVPYLGYMIRKEWWAKGVVGSATRSFIDAYWSLDRRIVEVSFQQEDYNDEASAGRVTSIEHGQGHQHTDGLAPEMLFAKTVVSNGASVKILASCGFELVPLQHTTPSVRDGTETTLEVLTYVLKR